MSVLAIALGFAAAVVLAARFVRRQRHVPVPHEMTSHDVDAIRTRIREQRDRHQW